MSARSPNAALGTILLALGCGLFGSASFGLGSASFGLGCGLIGLGCGSAAPTLRPLPVPAERSARHEIIDSFGRRLYGAVADARPESVLLDDIGLRAVTEPSAASRYAALRVGVSSRLRADGSALRTLQDARYAGVCLQGSRLEPPGSTVGLSHAGWTFDRILVVGLQPGGRRMAAWVEGTFIYTSEGFAALDLTRVEEPRWEHADLELAPCDMQIGIRGPRPVVDVTL